jgi:hypothetical protein
MKSTRSWINGPAVYQMWLGEQLIGMAAAFE